MTEKKKVFYSPNTFQSFGQDEMNAVENWLRNNRLDDQSIIEEFEKRIAFLFKVKYGIFVNSGSSANFLACIAIGIGKGHEVITPACTFPTTLSPIIFLGAKPVFCDVDTNCYVPSVQQVMKLVTPKTYAILIPDLVGDKFDFIGLRNSLEQINRSDIFLIEDACDTITQCDAHIATVSFYASHVISAGGCGGMVLVDDDKLANKCRSLRNEGSWDFTAPGFCAAFGLVNSMKFDQWSEARKSNLQHYVSRLKNCEFYQLPKNLDAIWLSFPLICSSHRYDIVLELESRGIQTRLCMAGNILRQPFYAQMFPDVDPSSFVETEKVFRGGILIGLHQGVSSEDVDWVCDQLLELASKYSD